MNIVVLQKLPKPFVYSLILTLLISILYAGSLDNPSVFDSTSIESQLTFDPHIEIKDTFKPRGLTYLSLKLIQKMNNSLWYQRLFNLVLHILNSLLLMSFLALFWNSQTKQKKPWTLSFFATLFFSLNPVAVYAVAYMIQRSILLATFFTLISAISFIKSAQTKKFFWHIACIFAFTCALYSKEHVILLPAVFYLMGLMLKPGAFKFSKIDSRLVTVLILQIVVGAIVALQLKNIAFSAYEQHLRFIATPSSAASVEPSIMLHFINQCLLCFRYLFLWIFPYLPWMSIDTHLPFPQTLFLFPQILGFPLFLSFLILSLKNICSSGSTKFLGLGALSFLILFSLEFTVIRVSEPFVLYRSYLWIVFALVGFGFFLNVKLRPKHFVVLIYPIILFSISCERLHSFDSVIAVWQDAVNKLPEKPVPGAYRTYNSLGYALATQGQYSAAKPYVEKSLELSPKYPTANYNRAFIAQSEKNIDEAIRYYKIAIENQNFYPDAHNNLGTLYLKKNNLEKAIYHFSAAVQQNPQSAKVLNNLGALYARVKKWDKAIENYQKSIELDPNYAGSYNNLGQAYFEMGDQKKAFQYFDKALKINPKLMDTYFSYGLSLYRLKKFKEAQQIYNQALKIAPKDSKIYFYLGNTATQQKNHSKALEYYQKAIALNPKYTNAYFNQGLLLLKLKQNKLARQSFEQCLKISPQDTNCRQGSKLIQ